MLVSLAIFAVGGALSGAANGSAMLFAGRTVQGLGGGGVLTLSSIILSDIVALHERGLYNGILGLWVLNAYDLVAHLRLPSVHVIGGSFAQNRHWRWLFCMCYPGNQRSRSILTDSIDMNIPFASLAAALVLLFVKLPVYYQACTLASPIRAGTLVFGLAFTVAPTTIVAGALITATKRYRPPIWFGWVLLLLGQGLLTTLTATSPPRSGSRS